MHLKTEEPCLEAFLAATGVRRGRLLDQAIVALRQKDQDLMPRDATAVSSEGIVSGNREVLDRFVDMVARELVSGIGPQGGLTFDKVVRALGYTSTPDAR